MTPNNTQRLLAQKLAGMTPSESSRLAPMRVKGPVVPKTFHINIPGAKGSGGGGGAPYDPYAAFQLADPYNPQQISSQAQSDYDADVARARTLASMGLPTTDQLNAQASQRAAAQQAIAASLSSHLGGIQQATVDQGNAGAASLAAQNAATTGTAPVIPGATAAPADTVTPAVRSVLTAQTNAGGNYYGSLQAAALQGGAQNAQRALDQGAADITANDQNVQRALASLLSGVDAPSKRVASMTSANQQVDAANIQTKLSVYQGLKTSEANAAALGEKKLEAQYAKQAKEYLGNLDSTTKLKVADAAAAGRTDVANINAGAKKSVAQIQAEAKAKAARIAAAGKTGKGAPTPASRQAALKQARAILGSRNKTGTSTKVPATYEIQYQTGVASDNPYAPKPTQKALPITAAAFNSGSWKAMLPSGAIPIGTPTPKTYTTRQTGRTGNYTLWNQSLSVLKQAGFTDAQARQALKPFKPAGVK